MKVAIVQETVDARRGGAETSTLEMAQHLAELGLDVTIVCRAAPADLPTNDVVRLVRVPAGGVTRALRTYRFLQGVHRLHLRHSYDIVHAVVPCLSANVYQPRGGTYPETIARSTVRVDSPALRQLKWLGRYFNLRQRFLGRVEQLLLRKRRDRVFVAAVSEYVRRQVLSEYGFPAERIRVVFNGVDITPLTAEETVRARAELRNKFGVGPDTPLVLFVAHNFKLKGLAELLRACALSVSVPASQEPARGDAVLSERKRDSPGWPSASTVGDTDSDGNRVGCPGASAVGDANSHVKRPVPAEWVLVVAGRDRPGPYRRMARQLGVAHRVHFVGSETPIRDWYAAADMLAHPTWYDPCSRVALEALSLGLPVVTTRYNGAAEVMEPGRHGAVIDWPGNIAGLATAITEALRPEVRAACRADAARLHEQLSMARHARELKALYHAVRVAETNSRKAERQR
jgi:glycosyltransferase involved in cell wall biosynthesis